MSGLINLQHDAFAIDLKSRRKVAELIRERIATGNPVADRKSQLPLEGMANDEL